MSGVSTTNGLDLQTVHNAPIGSNSVSGAVTNRIAAAKDVIALLAERWPHCFSVYERRRRPLKLGIHLEILAALDGVITAHELSIALRSYVHNEGYLRACRDGVDRIGLDGAPTGKVSARDAKGSAAILAYRAAKRQQTKKETPSAPAVVAGPKRLSLSGLKDAALRRKIRPPCRARPPAEQLKGEIKC